MKAAHGKKWRDVRHAHADRAREGLIFDGSKTMVLLRLDYIPCEVLSGSHRGSTPCSQHTDVARAQ
jgi:hypothetical protein